MNFDRSDFNTPEYKAWRYAVLARDQWTCQLTGKKGCELETHHIVPWAVAPGLRYAVSNGITLSKEAHEMVTGREKDFEDQFKTIVAQKMFGGKKRGTNKRGRPTKSEYAAKHKWKPRNPRLRYGW
jgi:hypothetical protein